MLRSLHLKVGSPLKRRLRFIDAVARAKALADQGELLWEVCHVATLAQEVGGNNLIDATSQRPTVLT